MDYHLKLTARYPTSIRQQIQFHLIIHYHPLPSLSSYVLLVFFHENLRCYLQYVNPHSHHLVQPIGCYLCFSQRLCYLIAIMDFLLILIMGYLLLFIHKVTNLKRQFHSHYLFHLIFHFSYFALVSVLKLDLSYFSYKLI